MKRLSYLSLIFTLVFAIFFMGLLFIRTPFSLYPLMSNQDAVDLFTPLVLLPFYWVLYKKINQGKSTWGEDIAFMILGALWVLGHGMHLAANSIDNLIENMSKTQQLDVTGSSIYTLTYFMDETLSHYIWHAAILGMILLLGYRDCRYESSFTTAWWVTILAGILYGFSLFAIFVEGQSVMLSLPVTAIFFILALIFAVRRLSGKPLLAFFFISTGVALVLFIGWGLYWGGFPEPSAVGLI